MKSFREGKTRPEVTSAQRPTKPGPKANVKVSIRPQHNLTEANTAMNAIITSHLSQQRSIPGGQVRQTGTKCPLTSSGISRTPTQDEQHCTATAAEYDKYATRQTRHSRLLAMNGCTSRTAVPQVRKGMVLCSGRLDSTRLDSQPSPHKKALTTVYMIHDKANPGRLRNATYRKASPTCIPGTQKNQPLPGRSALDQKSGLPGCRPHTAVSTKPTFILLHCTARTPAPARKRKASR